MQILRNTRTGDDLDWSMRREQKLVMAGGVSSSPGGPPVLLSSSILAVKCHSSMRCVCPRCLFVQSKRPF